MASNDGVKPSMCIFCQATLKCKTLDCKKCKVRATDRGCINGLWDYRTRRESKRIIWYCVCPECIKNELKLSED